MMRKYILLLFFCILSKNGAAQSLDYIWPTNASRYLSGTFGETRSAHFHAGWDIKTWGQEGYEVYATTSGILHRVGISAGGYGKVIYLKHDDGNYSIYAHLQRFEKKIQQLADSVRMANNHIFEIDLYIENDSIRIKKGDLIGYTGSTGVGPPHLHFELRDSLQRPFNPFLTNLTIKDSKPPVFSSLLIEPLEASSTVNQKHKPLVLRPQSRQRGSTDFGTVSVSGKIGIAVDVYDEANDVTNKYAGYHLALISGNDTLFSSKLERFDYEFAGDMFLDRAENPTTRRRSFQRLYLKKGINISLFDYSLKNYIPDSYPLYLKIIISDFSGNSSSATIKILPANQLAKAFNSSKPAPDWENPEQWFWADSWVSPDGEFGYRFDELYKRDFKNSPIFSNYTSQAYRVFSSSQIDVTAYSLITSQPYRIPVSGTDLMLSLPKNGLFKDQVIFTKTNTTGIPEIELFPSGLILKKPAELSYYIGIDSLAHYGFYFYDSFKKEYNYIDTEKTGGTIRADINEFGKYMILKDVSPPSVLSTKVVKTNFNRWIVEIRLGKDLSGINYKKSIIRVNEQEGITEFDREENTLIFYLPGFVPKTKNAVYASIWDNSGNETQYSVEIEL